jgi:hypothetical protein
MGKDTAKSVLTAIGEGLGIMLLANLGSIAIGPLFLIASVYLILKEKGWEIPSDTLTSSSVKLIQASKISLNALANILSYSGLFYLIHSYGPIL